MYKFLVILLLLSTVGCATKEQKKGMRITDGKGKVKYLERQQPDFNRAQLANQKLQLDHNLKTRPINPEISNNMIENTNSEDNHIIPANTIDPKLVEQSNAYQNKSVIDNLVANNEMRSSAVNPERQNKTKTIKDFDYLPDYLFIDGTPTKTSTGDDIVYNKNDNSNNNLVQKSYSLQSNNLKVVDNSKHTLNPNTQTAPQKGKYYIQLGSFASKKSAEDLSNKYKSKNIALVQEAKVKGNTMYRALVGHFDSRASAEKEMEKIILKGHYDVYIFQE